MTVALPAEISKWITLAIIIIAVVFIIKVGARLIKIIITA